MLNPSFPNAEASEPERVESFLLTQRKSLEMIAGGARLSDTLSAICDAIDAQDPGVISTVLVMDPDGKRLWPAAGSRVPPEWTLAITPLEIGPDVGSCGTAAYLRQPVIVADIASDPLFDRGTYREQALSHGLRAAWSIPLISKSDEVLGTFAMYYAEPRAPAARDLVRVETAAQLALIAIESERAQTALQSALVDIKRSEDRLRTIIDTIPALVWCFRPDGTVNYFNQPWHDYTGISREEAYGFGEVSSGTDVARAIIHPDDAPGILAKWQQQILPGTKPGEFEVRMRRHDGEYRWFMVRLEPMLNDSGRVLQWYGINTDIEDLKRAETKLRQDEQELRRIVDAIPQTIVVLNPEGKAVYANRTTLEYTGLTLDEVMSADFRTRVFHPEDVSRLADERRQALAQIGRAHV